MLVVVPLFASGNCVRGSHLVGGRRCVRLDGSLIFCSLAARQTIGVYPSARTYRLKGRSREFGRLRRPESVL